MPNPYQAPEAAQAPVQSPGTPPTLRQVLFSYKGRIPRRAYWLFSVVAMVFLLAALFTVSLLLAVIKLFLPQINPSAWSSVVVGVSLISYLIATWISICLAAKRCHDCNKSGWWMMIPVYGIILVGFIRGTIGPNIYGQDPT